MTRFRSNEIFDGSHRARVYQWQLLACASAQAFSPGAFEVWTSRDAQTGNIHLCPKPSEVRRQTRLRELLALMGLSDTHMQNLLSISVQVFAPWCKIEASSMRLFPF